MNIKSYAKQCAKYFLLLTASFLAGEFTVYCIDCFSPETVETSASGNWGLGFPEEGQLPTANATIEELKAYDAYFAEATTEKKLYLTFDCGYENGNTKPILEALKKHNAPAAFFCVGNFVKEQPDLIRQIVREGHTVGNHTYTHPDMSKISTKESFQEELEKVETLYEQITGEPMTKYYRPPQGIYIKPFFGALPMWTGTRISSRQKKKLLLNCFPAFIRALLSCFTTRLLPTVRFLMSF